MKRAVIVLLVTGLMAGALSTPAEAKKPKKAKPRTVTLTYGNPAFGVGGAGVCAGCPSTSNATNEVFVSGEVTDDVSPIGYVDLSWDSDGDGIGDQSITICGKTDQPVAVPGGVTFTAFPWTVPSPDCVGSSTSGTIKLTFSSTPKQS